ncbi:MAG: chorismate mutase [Clostridia bacterium]|nr:chorismate mutase [Clostridia bacterium]
MNDLERARKLISETDAQMAVLFEKRMQAARLVAAYKQERGLPILDAAREQELIAKGSARIEDEALRSYYVSFLQHTMDVSKAYQHRLMEGMRVAYSGAKGAFAHIAVGRIFPDATALGYADFAAAYRAVEQDECDVAVLPIENSYNGDVGQVMDLAFLGSLYINGIYQLQITQNLLVLPDTQLSDIKQVISHPQALGQCAEYIRQHGWKQVEAVNTAVAARQVAQGADRSLAAIGSEEAGKQYGLQRLEGHIEQSGGNTTRFAVFSRSDKPTDGRFVMTFTVSNVAGSLSRAVSVIGEHGFNLMALKSRPTKNLNWDYYFFVEGEGNIHSPEGKAMLQELNTCCSGVKVLGSFEKETVI